MYCVEYTLHMHSHTGSLLHGKITFPFPSLLLPFSLPQVSAAAVEACSVQLTDTQTNMSAPLTTRRQGGRRLSGTTL